MCRRGSFAYPASDFSVPSHLLGLCRTVDLPKLAFDNTQRTRAGELGASKRIKAATSKRNATFPVCQMTDWWQNALWLGDRFGGLTFESGSAAVALNAE